MKNPYFEGVQYARNTTPSNEQRTDNLSRTLLELASIVGKEPMQPRRGLVDNLAALAPQIGQVGASYLDRSKAQEEGNYKRLQDQIAEEVEARKFLMDQEWKQRNYDLKRNYYAAKLAKHANASSDSNDGVKIVDGKAYRPIKDKIDVRGIEESYKRIANSKIKFDKVKEDIEKMKETDKENILPSLGGFSKYTTPIKDWVGRITSSEDLQEDAAIRANVIARLGQLNLELEKASVGGYVPQGMYDRLKSFYPNLDEDNTQTLVNKLEHIQSELDSAYNAAKFSVENQVYADPMDFVTPTHEAKVETTPEFAQFQSPQGKIYNIPITEQDKIMRAEQANWMRLN